MMIGHALGVPVALIRFAVILRATWNHHWNRVWHGKLAGRHHCRMEGLTSCAKGSIHLQILQRTSKSSYA
jgi:hypothetical protein